MGSQRILFISYDGLTDQLGASQILPYILSLQEVGRTFTIISFEKSDRFQRSGRALKDSLQQLNIEWRPLTFTRRPKYLAKAWDLLRMYLRAIEVTLRHRIQLVHCRSYQAGQVGLFLKYLFGTGFLFDMRGLWADERVDGGLWDPRSLLPGMLYRTYRWLEKRMLMSADQIVTLTESSVPILEQRASPRRLPVKVIPCCADFDHFRVLVSNERESVRQALGVAPNAFLIGYLGSLGTWYMLAEMLDFFELLLQQQPQSYFLMITHDWSQSSEDLLKSKGLEGLRSRLIIRSANRDQVPALLGALDVSLCFIKPSFSKIASSPTKVAESLACGVPVVCNRGVGDLEEQVASLRGGVCLSRLHKDEFVSAIAELGALRQLGGLPLRERAETSLSLPVAATAYRKAYATFNGSLSRH